jgi:hypothetical protein
VKDDELLHLVQKPAALLSWSAIACEIATIARFRPAGRHFEGIACEITSCSQHPAALLATVDSLRQVAGGQECPRSRFLRDGGTPRRLRLDDEWYRVDLVFFHRRLRSLVVIDLKLGKFTHADAGQMHLYLNYAREHWTRPGENPPVGLILCAKRGEAVARYAIEGLHNKILAAEYRTTLPDEETIAAELERTRDLIEKRASSGRRSSRRKRGNTARDGED